MSVGTARLLAALYFVLFTVAVTWPGYLPFNTIEPQLLGMPFSMVWPTLWLLGAAPVLYLLDRVEARHRVEQRQQDEGS